MIVQSRGIVLNSIKYGDSSLIVKILTENSGLISFIVRRSKSKRSKNSSKIFFKLALVNLVFNYQDKKAIQNISESSLAYNYSSFQSDIVKSSIGLFLNEVLYKTIREEEKNKPLFEFIYNSLISFDRLENGINNFHLYFLLHFTKFLGIYPQNNYSEEKLYFNLYEGKFLEETNYRKDQPDKECSAMIHNILEINIDELYKLKINNDQRKKLISVIIMYYTIHHDNNLKLSSHEILEQVFS